MPKKKQLQSKIYFLDFFVKIIIVSMGIHKYSQDPKGGSRMDYKNENRIIIKELLDDKESVKQMRELNQLFSTVFEDPESYESEPPSNEYLASLLSDEHIIVLAAMDHERIAGGLTAYVLPKLEQERREIYIYDLAVSKNDRRKGIATSLIKELQIKAGSIGASAVFVQADPEDLPAIKLYESLGNKEDVFHYDILNERDKKRMEKK